MGCLFLKAKGVCVVSGFSLSRFDIRIIYSNLVISDVGGLLGRSPLAMEYLSPQDAGTLQQCCWDVIFSADINDTSGIPRKIAPDKQCRLDS